MAASEGAQAAVRALNALIRYSVGVGVGASILGTSMYNGESGPDRRTPPKAKRLLGW